MMIQQYQIELSIRSAKLDLSSISGFLRITQQKSRFLPPSMVCITLCMYLKKWMYDSKVNSFHNFSQMQLNGSLYFGMPVGLSYGSLWVQSPQMQAISIAFFNIWKKKNHNLWGKSNNNHYLVFVNTYRHIYFD